MELAIRRVERAENRVLSPLAEEQRRLPQPEAINDARIERTAIHNIEATREISNLIAQLEQQKELVTLGQLTAIRLEREVAFATVAFMIMLMMWLAVASTDLSRLRSSLGS